jgi:hypothetical protein
MDLFPELPQDLSKLTPEELSSLAQDIRAQVKKVSSRDPAVIGDLTMKEVLEQATAAVESLESINGEIAAREAAETQFDDELKKITEAAGVEEAAEVVEEVKEEVAAEVETVAAEAAVVAEAEAITEAAPEVVPELITASTLPAAKAPLPVPTPEQTPVVETQPGISLVAAAGIPGLGESAILDRMGLAEAMVTKRNQGTSMPEGYQEKVLIASSAWLDLYPDERYLRGDHKDTQKIQDVVSPEALVASGGLCAPVTNYYELMTVAVADRPVRDSLPSFAAVRGGLKFAAPPTIASVTGVGIKTAAQDALGGTFATKTCQVVACPSFSEKDLSMIYHCIQFGNLNSRAFPEQVAQFNELVLAAHARLAEQALLDGIAAASTAVTSTAIYGAYSTLVNDYLFAAAGLRSRQRMAVNAKIRVLAPEWVGDLIAADLTNRAFSDFQWTRTNVAELLAKQDLVVSWYMDTATGAGQVFGTQSAGVLLRFPTTVKSYIFPEGSFLFLDGGTLDLGIVRDSTLNSTNDFQIFGETFENIAFVGPESLALTSTVCPDGTTGPAATAITCS